MGAAAITDRSVRPAKRMRPWGCKSEAEDSKVRMHL